MCLLGGKQYNSDKTTTFSEKKIVMKGKGVNHSVSWSSRHTFSPEVLEKMGVFYLLFLFVHRNLISFNWLVAMTKQKTNKKTNMLRSLIVCILTTEDKLRVEIVNLPHPKCWNTGYSCVMKTYFKNSRANQNN